MENANEYSTKDFYIAAYLLAHGHKISYVNRDDPKRVFFAFDDFKGREDLVRAFLYSEAVVEPQAFIAAIKTLKGLIHSND
jgi:uncharacterized protein YbjT (DUF2867 family)